MAIPPFHVGTHVLPRVYQCTYLGVTIDARLSWTHHVNELLRRGERKMAACLSWTRSADLPVCFVERIFQTYVCPSVCFGMEFVDPAPQIRRFQTRLLQWGRRLLLWPRGSPGVVVQGQLGWQDASTLRLQQAADLWARLLSLPANCNAAHIVRYAASQPHSWVHLLISELNSVGVPRPDTSGIHMGCASSQLERWLRQLKRILSGWSNSLPTPDLNHIVYGQHVPAQSARYWALARCGHHRFSDGRAARHCNASIDHASISCRVCAAASDTLAHALLDCSAHTVLRRRWARKSRHSPISLYKLFSTDDDVNIQYVHAVRSQAEACEI